MLAYMKRTTVKLPDELDARLRHEADRRGVTISELTREAIETHLSVKAGRRRRLLAAGAGRSGHSDVSERIEEILAAEVKPSR
jgi:predicted transcriptional regulator